jgi:hypothetical protein
MQKLALRLAVVLVALFSLLGQPTAAFAAGQLKIKNTTIDEQSGAWRVIVSLIQLPKAPQLKRVPMRFIFTQTIVYERSLVDGKTEPQLSRINVTNGSPKQETLDVDFSDTSGKTFNQTRYDFGITRDSGYVAGEYKLTVRTSDGQEIGSPVTLILKGDNQVTDRRTMAFNTKDPKIKKVEGVDAGAPKPAGDTPAADVQGDVAPTGTAAPFLDDEAKKETEEENIKVKKGACGCEAVGTGTSLGWPLVATLGIFGTALFAARRRRSLARTARL